MGFDRRQFLTTSSIALAGTALARVPVIGQAPAGQTPPPAVTAFEDIRRNVGIFTGRGGAIGWLATPAGAVAVDAQFPDTAKACVTGLQQKSAKGILLLINTHYHGDHTGGNPVFRPVVKSIVQQERCAKLHKDMTAKAGTGAQQAYADVTFGESWSQDVGDEKVWGFFHGAGHTGGDAVIVFERANVVHMGDLMFNQRHPVVDRAAGATLRNWMKVLDSAMKDHANDTIYIFGHANVSLGPTGVVGSATEITRFRDYLGALLAFVEAQHKAGKSKDEILAMRDPLPGFENFGRFGQANPRDPLTCAYEEITTGS